MTFVKALYKLEPILDNPKYEGFGMGDLPSLTGRRNRYNDLDLDFDPKVGEWVVPRLAAIWTPLRVIGRVRPFNDFPCLGLSYPVLSQRAVDVLRDFLEPNGELLPLITSVGSYFLYNCTTVADVIDFDRSKLNYLNKNTVLEVDHLDVHVDRLQGLSIFRIRKYHNACCVTDAVARRIREAKLAGIELRKLWPLPAGVTWWLHRKLPECHDELTAQSAKESRPIKGNSVVIGLVLSGKDPSPREQSRIKEIANELDGMLVTPRRNARYFGNLETAEFIPGEARFFLSGPDADELAKKVKPWIKSLDWPGKKWLLKRYGEFVDAEASEEAVAL